LSQVVECLTSKHKALSLSPSTTRKEKRKKKKYIIKLKVKYLVNHQQKSDL
jgi:hypothetical protein